MRFSITEFFLVSRLRYSGNDDVNMFAKSSSHLKHKYFSTLKVITDEDIKDSFLAIRDIPNEDVSKLAALYFITSFLYPRDHK